MSALDEAGNVIGRVVDIQRFSLHDGPGIRTSVFLKGCNMHCAWCHNPETISFEQDVIVSPEKCIHCGRCDEGCFSGARRVVGEDMSVAQVISVIMEDSSYYENDGGLTITGGEPCLQPKFTKTLLQMARAQKIHTAIETNLAVPQENLKDVVLNCDLVMCDLKMLNSAQHRAYTGIGNERILENLCFLDRLEIPIVVRTPVIKEINDNNDEIRGISMILKRIKNLKLYELLPYHQLGLSKRVEGMKPQEVFETPTARKMEELAQIACDYLGNVAIQGKRVGEA